MGLCKDASLSFGPTLTMAAAQGKVISTCGWTGSIHTPTMSPYLPITPEEIADAAIAAAQAGAAIVHLHARDPKDGRPTQDPELFRKFATKIKGASDVVINFTTGGAPTMSIDERLQPQPRRRAAHEAHRRSPVRRCLSLVGARRRPQPDVHRRDERGDGRQRARRPGGQRVARARAAR